LKANFQQEQSKLNNNDSDISDEDMGDIDENIVNNSGSQQNSQRPSHAQSNQYSAKQQTNSKHHSQANNENVMRVGAHMPMGAGASGNQRGQTLSPTKYKPNSYSSPGAGSLLYGQQPHEQVSARASSQSGQSMLKQPGFM
jgi:hypothetical protein